MNVLILEKRLSESLVYDIDCSPSLAANETITAVATPTADNGGVTFGVPVSNSVPVTYPDGVTAGVGKVVQVRITGGVIPAGSTLPDGRPGLRCTLRGDYTTAPQNNTREWTVLLDLTDTPA